MEYNANATSATANNLSAGTFTVTVTDAMSCTQTANVTIIEPLALSVSTSSTNVSCNGGNNGSATATVSGGTTPYAYLWNTTPTQTSATANNLSADTFTVTVTDAMSCTQTASVTITEPAAAITLTTSSTDATCNGCCDGTLSATASGGTPPYSYIVSPGSCTLPCSSLCAMVYTVCVEDVNGCLTCQQDTINEPTTGVNESANYDLQFTIFPNPNDGKFMMRIAPAIWQYAAGNEFKIEIYNVMGECIYKSLILNPNSLIDISSQPNGIYFLTIKTEQSTTTKKLIIQK